jgi:hypothetical protein
LGHRDGPYFLLLQMLPIPAPFKNFVMVLFIIVCILILLGAVGFLGPVFPVYHYR